MNKKKIITILLSFILVFTFTTAASAKENNTSSASLATSTARSGDYMYYSVYNKLYKVNVKTKKSTLILKSNKVWQFSQITVKDGWIYCTADLFGGTGGSDVYIYKIRTNGKDGKFLQKGHSPVLYQNKIYYIKMNYEYDGYGKIDTNTIGIYSMSTSGKSNKCLKKANSVYNLIVYKSNIYYLNGTYLKRMNLSGGASKTMCSNNSYSDNLIAYSDYIYFNSNDSIYKIKTTSTKKVLVVKNAELKSIYNNFIYYTKNLDYTSCTLYKMNLSSKSKTTIMSMSGIANVDTTKGYIMVVYYYSGYPDNTALYLCNDKGKNGKVLARYYVS